ncbi:MAG: hypothetical protein K6C97_05855 [Treponema sp.]|nr:hypothetical protein [Treponema sp.]
MTKRELSLNLKEETEEIHFQIQAEFWQPYFSRISKRHSYQKDFFLQGDSISSSFVIERFEKLFSDLSLKYKLDYDKSWQKGVFQLRLHLCYFNKKTSISDDFFILINRKDISLRLLERNQLIKHYSLEEYSLAESFIEDFCNELFTNEKNKLLYLKERYKEVRSYSKGLNPKTIEIAQNSIKTIYETNVKSNRSLLQKSLYSSFLYKGKVVRIFHSRFMENPSILINALK